MSKFLLRYVCVLSLKVFYLSNKMINSIIYKRNIQVRQCIELLTLSNTQVK